MDDAKITLITTICILLSSHISAWEVNTHRAIDRCAMLNNQNHQRATNLHQFVKDMGVENESYKDEEFEGYSLKDGTSPVSYFKYAKEGENKLGISIWGQEFSSHYYSDLIEAGTILEDALWEGITQKINEYAFNPILGVNNIALYGANFIANKSDSAKGRFNYHFSDVYNNYKGLTDMIVKKNHSANTNIVDWAKGEHNATLYNLLNKPEPHYNMYGRKMALEYFKKGFIEETVKDSNINKTHKKFRIR